MAFRRKGSSVSNTTVVTGDGQTVASSKSGGRKGSTPAWRPAANGTATNSRFVSGSGNHFSTDASLGDVNQSD